MLDWHTCRIFLHQVKPCAIYFSFRHRLNFLEDFRRSLTPDQRHQAGTPLPGQAPYGQPPPGQAPYGLHGPPPGQAPYAESAAAFDMSMAAQAEGGIVINQKLFDFETCEEINLCNSLSEGKRTFEWEPRSNVRLPSLDDVARRAMRPAPAVPILASRPAADMQLTPG